MSPRTGDDETPEITENDMPIDVENVVCPECGATWDGDTKNCSVCGANLGFEGEDTYPEGGEEEAPCEHCGAPLGMPCEPGCPNAEELGPDPDRYCEGVVREGRDTKSNHLKEGPGGDLTWDQLQLEFPDAYYDLLSGEWQDNNGRDVRTRKQLVRWLDEDRFFVDDVGTLHWWNPYEGDQVWDGQMWEIAKAMGEGARGEMCKLHGIPMNRKTASKAGDYECPECYKERMHEPRESRQLGGTEFDKFMDRTLIEERQRVRINAPETNPRRLQAARHQDRPMNRVRFVRGSR